MKRNKTIKKILAFTLALAMVFTMGVTYMPSLKSVKADETSQKTNEETSQEVKDNASSDKEASSQSKDTDSQINKSTGDTSTVSEDTKSNNEINENNKTDSVSVNDFKGRQLRDTPAASEMSLSGTFNGVSANDANTGEIEVADPVNTPQILSINGSFKPSTAAAPVTEKTLTIYISAYMSLAAAPGMKQSNGTWTFDKSIMPDGLLKDNLVSGEWRYGGDIPMRNGNIKGTAGAIIYTFADNTGDFSMDLSLQMNSNYYVIADATNGRTYDTPFSFYTSENENGNLVNSGDPCGLESYICGKGDPSKLYTRKNDSDTSSEWQYIDSDVNANAYMWFMNNNSRVVNKLFSQIEFTVVFPSAFEVADDPSDVITFPTNITNCIVTPMTETVDGNGNTSIKVILNDIGGISGFNYYLHYHVKDDPSLIGHTYQIKVNYDSFTVYGGDDTRDLSGFSVVAIDEIHPVPTDVPKILQAATVSDTAYHTAYYKYGENMSDGSMSILGAYGARNQTPDTLNNQWMKLSFENTDDVVVREIYLLTPSGDVTDVHLLLSDGSTRDITSPTAGTKKVNVMGGSYQFNLTKEGITDESLGIEEISWKASGFQSDYGKDKPGLRYGSLYYAGELYGRISGYFKANPGQFKYHLFTTTDDNVSNNEIVDDDATKVSKANYTSNVETKDSDIAFQPRMQVQVSSGTLATSLTAGQRYSLPVTSILPMSSPCINTAAYYTKGVEIYLRDAGLFDIDLDSIQLKDNMGNTYTNGDGTGTTYKLTTSNDSTGKPVYVLTAYDAQIGCYANLATGDSITLSLTYDFTVKKSATATGLTWNKVFQVKPIGDGILCDYKRIDANVVTPDTYDVDGNGVTDTEFLGAIQDTKSLTINEAKTFLKDTAAQRTATGVLPTANDWLTYDTTSDTTKENTTLGVNQYSDTYYRVHVANHTDNDAGNFSVLIPIPKRGTTFADNAAFKWSAKLVAPVDYSTAAGNSDDTVAVQNVTITYSKDPYVDSTSSTAATFGGYSATDAKDYTMVKISGTSMKAGTDLYYMLKLGVGDTEAEQQTDSGTSNIYHSLLTISAEGNSIENGATEPVSMRLDTAVIKGRVFIDKNRDGDYDYDASATDTSDVLWTGGGQVNAYKHGTTHDSTTLINGSPFTVGTNGEFMISNLESGHYYDLVFTTPSYTTDTYRFYDGTNAPTHSETYTISNVAASDGQDYDGDAGLITPYTVKFDLDGATAGTASAGAISTADQKVYIGEKVKKPTVSLTKTGYQADTSWYKTEYTSGATNTFDFDKSILDTANEGLGTDNANLSATDFTIYANMIENSNYKVNYDTSSGDTAGTYLQKTSVKWTDTNLLSGVTTDPTKTGYTIGSWNTNSGGTAAGGVTVNATTKYSAAAGDVDTVASVTLYPIWSADTVNITYTATDADSYTNAVTASKTGSYDGYVTAPTVPKRSGYSFSGWTTDSTPSATSTKWVFSGSTSPTALTTTNGVSITNNVGGITLYPIWSANSVAITYNQDNPTTAATIPTASKTGTLNGTVTNPNVTPIKEGYTFAGWQGPNQSGTIYWQFAEGSTPTELTTANGVSIDSSNNATITLKAAYTANDVAITYDTNASGDTVTFNQASGS
ncbi:MAG: InlB B-repeat-containing protein, partial [Lachnospiraceae bacterium]|nr:InlB B-repeat-containing protein [Lachnospiraceae bacterium]